MDTFQPKSDKFREIIRDGFAKQGFMSTLSATLGHIEPGFVEIEFPYSPSLTQQHGFVHAGALAAIADTAGGFAALSLFNEGDGVLTVEFKINLMAPAKGEHFVARGQVIRPGRTLTLTQGEVVAIDGEKETQCALMQQTMMRITDRTEVVG